MIDKYLFNNNNDNNNNNNDNDNNNNNNNKGSSLAPLNNLFITTSKIYIYT